ncbi:unnamed protein product [Didymodactylos carnosus]|uniref:Uncharacterized protein n=1 Tax=Didymodactylos carnosus TaxID=1234261 RepID=A0A815B491_9BILA|nr:unnamed protein product [Didymodactylos carnosus]CAF1266062.1 unnamed protein product [Didymodactylos carnosus]CAF3806123.1 unnamed protein product [Didymodactylos carnosus]CAF4049121.1 unnamed protein product [Didymodactylos carnosus]
MEGVMIEIVKVKVSAGQFLDKATKIIQEAIDEKAPSKTTHVSAPTNVKILCERSTQQWKQILIQTTNQAIANQVVAPLLSFGANQLISLAGNAIKKKYRSMKEEKYQKQFDSLKKDFDDKTKDEQMNADEYEKEFQAYHDTIMKLLAKTRSPKLFANILRENVPMDMVCVQACTYVLHKYMSEMNITGDGKKFTGIRIIVEGQDGSSHDYSSSSNPSHSINISLDNNHFVMDEQSDGNIETSKNNCLYKALVNTFPALKRAFANGAAFRQHLSSYIENDKSMHHTISQGWHKFSIKKGSYGGAIEQKKFDRQSLYDAFLENTGNRIAKLIEKYPKFAGKVRQRFDQRIKEIKEIAQKESQSDETFKRINKITNDFSMYLIKEFDGEDRRELREELHKIMSGFGIRLNQTLHPVYIEILNNMKLKTEQADTWSSHPLAIHPADQINFTQDDIRLQSLTVKWMKLPESVDIIASVIHAELNKEVCEDERRFNTVGVGIDKKTLYIAMNQTEVTKSQQKYGISSERFTQICNILISKKLVMECEEIVLIAPNVMPKNQAQNRALHAEKQIMKFWKDNGILPGNQITDQNKPSRIGASKPACICCSLTMTTNKIHYKTYAKANTNPVNWTDPTGINVRVQNRVRVRN